MAVPPDERQTDIDSRQILLVEDNPAHAELITRCLRGHGAAGSIVHPEDGRQALDYLLGTGAYAGSSCPRPRVVLLDLRLPEVDGLQVLEEVRRHETFDDMPVVVLTTSSDRRDLGDAYARRANSYLVKPVEFERLSQMLDDLGTYWLDWNQGLS